MQSNAAVGTPPVALTPDQSQTKALYYVVGTADPALLARLVEPAAKLGFVPTRLHASAEAGDGSQLTVDLRLGVVPLTAAKRIEAMMRRVVDVEQVIAVYEAA